MSKEITLYGPDNRPIPKKVLTAEVAAPTLTGVRSVWGWTSMADGLTPGRLAAILRDAADGSTWDYLTLAEEMEEREPHYGSVLGTRKRAVSGLEPVVEAASDAPEDKKIADAVRELIRKPGFGECVDDLLDALGKGYSAVEMKWAPGQAWVPRYKWRDPRFFVPDENDGHTLRLADEQSHNGVELPPCKFIVHYPRLKSGLPIRGGLARLAAASYMCKSFALKDWMAFAEVFGMPLRIGRHKPGALPKDIDTLIKAVANIGSDAAAVLPDNMRIEFVEAAKSAGGEKLFQGLAEWLDRQVSKAVLGQVASTEGTPGKLGNDDTQAEVRQDILKADAKALGNTVSRDMVRPFVDFNFGRREKYPRVLFPVQEAEDLAVLSDALEKLVPLGLKVPAGWTRKKYGIPDPAADDELLVPQTGGAAADQTKGDAQETGQNRALNREGDEPDLLAEMADEAARLWEPVLAPVVDPVMDLAEKSGSFDDFLNGLAGLSGKMDAGALVESLARATFKARGMGDATDDE